MSSNTEATCERCKMSYRVDEDGCPETTDPFTCDDCGGAVRVETVNDTETLFRCNACKSWFSVAEKDVAATMMDPNSPTRCPQCSGRERQALKDRLEAVKGRQIDDGPFIEDRFLEAKGTTTAMPEESSMAGSANGGFQKLALELELDDLEMVMRRIEDEFGGLATDIVPETPPESAREFLLTFRFLSSRIDAVAALGKTVKAIGDRTTLDWLRDNTAGMRSIEVGEETFWGTRDSKTISTDQLLALTIVIENLCDINETDAKKISDRILPILIGGEKGALKSGSVRSVIGDDLWHKCFKKIPRDKLKSGEQPPNKLGIAMTRFLTRSNEWLE